MKSFLTTASARSVRTVTLAHAESVEFGPIKYKGVFRDSILSLLYSELPVPPIILTETLGVGRSSSSFSARGDWTHDFLRTIHTAFHHPEQVSIPEGVSVGDMLMRIDQHIPVIIVDDTAEGTLMLSVWFDATLTE